MSNKIIASNKKRLHITTVDGIIKYLNPKDTCGNLFTPNSFLYIDYRYPINNANFNYINYASSRNEYIMSDTISANGKFVLVNAEDIVHGRPSTNLIYKNNEEEKTQHMIKLLNENYFENFSIEFDMKEDDYTEKIIIQNNGNLLGEFPSFIYTGTNVNTSNVNDHIIAIENMGESTINFDNNNVLLNTS